MSGSVKFHTATIFRNKKAADRLAANYRKQFREPRQRCLEGSPCSSGMYNPSVRQPCIRLEGHEGLHQNRYWEWNEGDLEPRWRRRVDML